MASKFIILESIPEIAKQIQLAFVKDLNIYFAHKLPEVYLFIKTRVEQTILTDPTSDSLKNGVLKTDFGLNFDPVPAIAKAVADSVELDFNQITPKLKGGYEIRIQPLDYLNILTIPESIVITEKGVQLPWFEWLALYGNSVIVMNFGVFYNAGMGRSQGGIMVPSMGPFMVDPAYSGTQSDNWITRAIEADIPNLEQGLIKILS